MKKTFLQKLLGLSALSLICAAAAYAGKAPLSIVAAETPQNMAPNTTQVITYTIHNNVPTAPVKINLAPNRTTLIPGSPLITWNFTDDCVYKGMADYVPPNGNCDINLSITTGSQTGPIQQSVNINYGPTFQNITPAPVINFTVNGGGGGGGLFFTNAPTGQDMLFNSTQDIIWTVQNSTSTAIPLVAGGTNFTVPSSLIATPVITNDCNNSVPGNNGVCHIQASIQSLSTAGNVNQYLAVTYNASSRLVVDSPTNFNISGSNPGSRTFSLVNKCSYPVWFSFWGSGSGYFGCSDPRINKNCDQIVPNSTAGTFFCDTAAVGPTPNSYLGQCTWKSPVVSTTPTNKYMLTAKTGTVTVQLPKGLYSPSPPQPEVWSGTISGRTGCPTPSNPGTQCLTGDCGGVVNNVTGGCTTGISPPNIQAEPTLQTNTDYYDVTSINGINVPMSMEPVNAPAHADNTYHCGGAGIATNQTGTYGTLGGCPWTFTPPGVVYNWINAAGASCSTNGACNQAAGEACGLTRSDIGSSGPGSNVTHCGKWLGYWTADEVCTANSSYAQAPFYCASTCSSPACYSSISYTNLYGCNGGFAATSCYNNGTGQPQSCCGCQDWQLSPYNITLPTNVQQCSGNGDTGWGSIVLPQIAWLKAACPSMYSFPYDDPSSSFQCTSSVPENAVNYRVTFCPGGSEGAPAGTTPNP